MHQIQIIAIGKLKQSHRYLQQGIDLYQTRLQPYAKISWVELPEESPTATRPVAQVLAREADAMLKHCSRDDFVILLDEAGTMLTSAQFAQQLFGRNPLNGGRDETPGNRIIVLIGGAYGTSERLFEKASLVVSLSRMTFPHQLVRLLLLEQIYRAFTIIHHMPYHK